MLKFYHDFKINYFDKPPFFINFASTFWCRPRAMKRESGENPGQTRCCESLPTRAYPSCHCGSRRGKAVRTERQVRRPARTTYVSVVFGYKTTEHPPYRLKGRPGRKPPNGLPVPEWLHAKSSARPNHYSGYGSDTSHHTSSPNVAEAVKAPADRIAYMLDAASMLMMK